MGTQVLGPGVDKDEERFCTYFGRAMAVPKKSLGHLTSVDESTILEVATRFHISATTAIEQMMEYGMLPTRIAVDSYNGTTKNPDYSQRVTRQIICQHCQTTGGDINCPEAGSDTLLFDFTDRAWGSEFSSCCGENFDEPAILSALTKYYTDRETQHYLFRPGASFEYDSEHGKNIPMTGRLS